MAKKRVFVDTNVILECFRINVWTDLTQRCQVETVEMCVTETLTGRRDKSDFVEVDPAALKAGLHKIHEVSTRDVGAFYLAYDEMKRLDPGELHLFAYLYVNKVRLSEVTVLSTADKGAILRANDVPGWLDWIQSLQEVLKEAKVPRAKVDALRHHHTSAFLSKVRTDVRNGVIP
jgi:hypothetical protein